MKSFERIPPQADEFIKLISTLNPSWHIQFKEEHESTQIMAKKSFLAGNNNPTIFIVRTQSAGRGRRDRTWVSSPDGHDITMTLMIPIDPEIGNVALLNLIGGLSATEAISDYTSHDFNVKWPNDIFHGLCKIGGICSELHVDNLRRSVAMGIGMNVNSSREEYSGVDSFYRIDTISSIMGRKMDIAWLVSEVAGHLQANLPLIHEKSFDELERKWRRYDKTYKKAIRYREHGGRWSEGICGGITSDGYLIVLDKDGNLIKTLVEGDVVPIA